MWRGVKWLWRVLCACCSVSVRASSPPLHQDEFEQSWTVTNPIHHRAAVEVVNRAGVVCVHKSAGRATMGRTTSSFVREGAEFVHVFDILQGK